MKIGGGEQTLAKLLFTGIWIIPHDKAEAFAT